MRFGTTVVTIRSLMRRKWMDTEMRIQINLKKVTQYAAEMADGSTFPNPVVFVDPRTELYLVGDGFHRILAKKENGEKTIAVELRRGRYTDAVLYNIEANRDQRGLPFTTGDKARCIATLLTNPETSSWSDTKIASVVGCSIPHVGHVAKRDGIERPGVVIDCNGRAVPHCRDRKDREAVARRRQKVLEMTMAGKTQMDMTQELHVSRPTIQRDLEVIAKEKGLVQCPHCNGTGLIEKAKLKCSG